MESGPNLLNQPIWRIGRWVVTIGAIVAAVMLLPGSRPVQLWSGILITGALLLPEVGRFIPQLEPYQSWIGPICDIALAAVLTLAVNPVLAIVFAPLLLGLVSLGDWRWVAAAGTAFFVVQAVQLFPAGEVWTVTETELLIAGVILLGFVTAGWFAQRLAHETTIRQELEHKLQIRSDKYLMRAHEIRTPLALIQASVELILDGAPGPITEKQKIFLENIDENCHQIKILAENMLTKGKLDSGIFQPSLNPADIRDTIREVVANMRTFTDRREQKIRTYYPQMLPMVKIDAVLMRQTLLNLIQNAIRHTSSGGQIMVTVSENDNGLLLAITDDGAGMTLEQRQQLFHRFVSGSGGTGLGLLIVKQIVELHGGKVLVDTSLGKGTTFFVTIPFDTETQPVLGPNAIGPDG
ncbi:MAG: HAMP domain-containing sensor histidine kinase [Chloroflexota bacterium]